MVHAHNYEAPIAALLAKRFTGTPIVYSAHNTMHEELPTYFRRPLARRFAGRVGAVLDRTVPRMAEHAVVLADEAEVTLRKLGCREVTKVAPGVDFAELEDVVPAELPEGPWVVYAGNPDVYQDLPVLMDAMRQLDGVGLLMVSASCLDDWAQVGLPKFMAVQTSDFSEVKRLVAAADVAAIPRTVCSGFPIKRSTHSASASRRWWLRALRAVCLERWWFPTETPGQWRAPYVTFSRPLSIGAVSPRAHART